jgi:two-component system chemotaxis sensor kinase CheA
MEKYAHLVENMLDKVRDGSVQFDKRAAEFILSIIADVKELVNSLVNKEEPRMPKTYNMLTDLSNTMLQHAETAVAMTDDVKVFLGQVDQFIEMIDISKDSPQGGQILRRAAAGLKNAAKFVGFKDLMGLADSFESAVAGGTSYEAELISITNYIDSLSAPPKMLGELLIDSGKVTEEEIELAKAQQRKIGEILVDQGKLEKEDLDVALRKQNIMKAAEQAKEQSAPDGNIKDVSINKDKLPQSMKVDQEKIDKFTNTIGELVVAKNAYEYMVQKLILDYDLPSSLLKDFKDNSNLIARISQDLQRDILSLRMLPIRQIFNKFPRVVRDIARKQDKQIELRIIGEDTEIDKKIADILSDPLVHLVRNACDHGLENADDRISSGKLETGNLILKAYNEGSFVYIEVIDDGRGINSKKVLQKAISKGLVAEDEQLSEKDIIQLILEPGFSTADQVTDISGRGVGMDVVKSSITSVGGFIDVSSSEGEGSRITMKIPVTIGMSTSLLVRMNDDEFYAFPIENVAETIKVSKDDVKDLHFSKGIYYRGNVLPLFQLSKLLGGKEKELDDEVNIVISVTDAGKTGIIVDELLNRMDIAIKPVPEYFAHLNYIGGVTILGDGQAVLVLNVNQLF